MGGLKGEREGTKALVNVYLVVSEALGLREAEGFVDEESEIEAL